MTKLVAILNITPDSFSDGGKYNSYNQILEAALKFIADGADVIDIGAESTRPDAKPLDAKAEWQRLKPVLSDIIKNSHEHNVKLSLDTRHAQNAKRAIDLGIDWINDVSGFADMDMVDAVKNTDVSCVLMHSLTVPADKSVILPKNRDVVEFLIDWAADKIVDLGKYGINKDRIIFDPGLGFGKDAEQSWQIIDNIEKFQILDVPLFIGHSRKSFLGGDMGDRDGKTLEVSKKLMLKNVDYLRVHAISVHKKGRGN